MTPADFVYVIQALLCAAVLIWFFSEPWQTLWTAVSRQRLFELRDRLFDLAADGRISFSDPAYLEAREYLNYSIRRTHTNTFGQFVVGVITLAENGPHGETVLDTVERVQDEAMRRELREILFSSVAVEVGHMVIRSPLLWVLLPVVVCVVALSAGGEALAKKMFQWLTLTLDSRDQQNAHVAVRAAR